MANCWLRSQSLELRLLCHGLRSLGRIKWVCGVLAALFHVKRGRVMYAYPPYHLHFQPAASRAHNAVSIVLSHLLGNSSGERPGQTAWASVDMRYGLSHPGRCIALNRACSNIPAESPPSSCRSSSRMDAWLPPGRAARESRGCNAIRMLPSSSWRKAISLAGGLPDSDRRTSARFSSHFIAAMKFSPPQVRSAVRIRSAFEHEMTSTVPRGTVSLHSPSSNICDMSTEGNPSERSGARRLPETDAQAMIYRRTPCSLAPK